MPYNSVEDLPESVKSVLPEGALSIFLAAFNAAYGEYDGDEGKSFSVAWAAVKKKYEKVNGKWKAIGNAIIVNSEFVNTEHDAILQTLDRNYNIPGIGNVKFTKTAFEQSVEAWNGIPVIFAHDHPNATLLSQNKEQALKDVDGVEVGQITLPRIELKGHPRLMGTLQINNDILDGMIDEGKLSHSTGFIGKIDENGNMTQVIPNHLLVFIEDAKNQPRDKGAIILNQDNKKKPYGEVEYADPGYQEDGVYRYPLDSEKHVRAAWSYIHMPKNQKPYSAEQLAKIKARIISAAKKYEIDIQNMEIDMAGTDYTNDDMSKMLDFMKANPHMVDKEMMEKLYGILDVVDKKNFMKQMLMDLKANPSMIDADMASMMKGMASIKNKQETEMTEGKELELTQQLEISNKENETLKAELTGMKEQLLVFEQKETERKKLERDAQWQTIKKGIPIGMTHKAEDETKLRQEWESDPYGFSAKLTTAEFKMQAGTPEEGKEFMNLTDEQKAEKDVADAIQELRELGGRTRPRRG